ncbi:MAG: response regulator [Myxococcota bacterium]
MMVAKPSHAAKIMVIDDSELVITAVRMILEDAGYTVVALSSPFGTSPSILREKPDLVLLDLMMPGLTGDRIVEVVRKTPALAHTCIVLHSDRDPVELSAAAARCGADGFIVKTCEEEDLLGHVRELLARRRGATTRSAQALI